MTSLSLLVAFGGLETLLHNESISNSRRFSDLFSLEADQILEEMRHNSSDNLHIDLEEAVAILAATIHPIEELVVQGVVTALIRQYS